MGMVGFVFMYLLRINLSVAMVCMVKERSIDNTTGLNDSLTTRWENDTGTDGCGRLEKARRASGLVT